MDCNYYLDFLKKKARGTGRGMGGWVIDESEGEKKGDGESGEVRDENKRRR